MSARLDAAFAELVAALREEVGADAAPAAPDRLLDVDAAAAMLSVGRSTVYQEIATGRLRSVKVGRRRLIPSSAVDEFVAMQTAVAS